MWLVHSFSESSLVVSRHYVVMGIVFSPLWTELSHHEFTLFLWVFLPHLRTQQILIVQQLTHSEILPHAGARKDVYTKMQFKTDVWFKCLLGCAGHLTETKDKWTLPSQHYRSVRRVSALFIIKVLDIRNKELWRWQWLHVTSWIHGFLWWTRHKKSYLSRWIKGQDS